MTIKKRRFGVSPAVSRGLTETISIVENNEDDFRNAIIPLSRIEVDPDNPRKLSLNGEEIINGPQKMASNFEKKQRDFSGLVELSSSIAESGLIHPIVVYKLADKYRIVAGERRFLAFQRLKRQEIDARVFTERPKGYKLKLVQWFENNTRIDLNLHERVNNIRELYHAYQNENKNGSLTMTLLTQLIGVSKAQASCYLAVLTGPEDLQAAIRLGLVSNLDKAAVIAKIGDENLRQTAIDNCHRGDSLRSLKDLVAQHQQSKKNNPAVQTAKRGKGHSRVNLGHASNAAVARILVECVLNHPALTQYKKKFDTIEWDDLNSASKSFKLALQLVEQHSEEIKDGE